MKPQNGVKIFLEGTKKWKEMKFTTAPFMTVNMTYGQSVFKRQDTFGKSESKERKPGQ